MNLGCVFDRSESIRSFIYGIITMRNLITCKWIHLCLVLVLVKFVLNDCPFPPKKLPHGRFLYQSPKDKNATTAVENYLLRFKCFRKFNLIGNKAIVCVEGKWTGFMPTCAKMQCSEPPEIDNGVSDVHTGVNSVPVIGATAEYFCDKGYELKNSTVSTLTCVLTKSNSVTWAGEVPSCIKKESCIDPGVSVDGKREGDCCFAGDILKFSCDEDYELVGHSEIQCLANAEWTFERPLCRPLEDHCATPPAIPHGRVEGFKEGDYYLPYDEVDVICDRGYSYEGESPIILCEEDGEWEMEFGKCVEASCELPQPLANGTILELQSTNLTTFPYSYELTYVCDKGFRLVEGDSWRFCCVGGHEDICDDSGWSGRTPYCEVIKCPDPGVPEHGSREGKSFDVGAKVHFSCSAGYELLGSFERHCRPNGQWTGELARCDTKTNYCSNPGIPINGYKNSSNYDMGDIVGFGCIKDYTQLGSKSRLCLPNRTWSGTETICLGPYDYDRGAQVSDSLKASINSKVIEQRKKLKKYRQDFYSAFHRNGSFVPVGRILDLNYPGRLILYFVFDSSGSVGKENFVKSVEFAKAIVKKVGISKSGARAGAVIFSSKAEIMFSPLVYETTEGVLEALGRIDFTGGGTAANSALTLVREELIPLTQAVLGRKGQKSVLFILTDGRANMGGDPKEEAQELKNAGVEIYCIGITGSVKKKTLYSMASDSTAEPPEPHVFILDNYATLAWLIQEITNGTIDYSKCGLGMEEAGDRIPRARILGGNYTVKPWPWMVALYFIPLGKFDPSEAELLCGGSIIHEKFVLTAAHCMFAKDKKGKKKRRNVNEIILKLGLTNVKNESFTQKPEVNEIYLHPKYSSTSGNYDYDIALLQLKNPIEYSARIRPICLPPKEQLPDSSFYEAKEFGLVTGWGHKDVVIPGTDFQIKSTEDLKELILPIQSRKNCKESLKEKHVPEAYFTKQMFCAGDGRGGNDTCQGDSGGPFMQSRLNEDGYLYWTQVGIVSWGVGCGLPNTYGYYSHVQILRGWIDNTIEQAMNKNVEEDI